MMPASDPSRSQPSRFPRVAVLGLLTTLCWVGCKPAAKTEAQPEASSLKSSEPAPVVHIEGLHVGQVSEADQAWEELAKSLQAPPAPADWEGREPSSEELAKFEAQLGIAAAEGAKKSKAFYEKFPAHEKSKEARDQELELLGVAAELGQTNVLERLASLESAQLGDPARSEVDRLTIRIKQIQRQIKQTDDSVSSNTVAVMETGVRALQKDFPTRMEPQLLLVSVADGWMTAGETDRAQTLLAELAKVELPEEAQEGLKRLQDRLNRLGKPVTLKLTSLQGKPVDLTSLQGKVVLIHFWATWSANSVAELPKLKKVYESLHARGFEIISISLDPDRPEIEQAVADHQLSWPQGFGKEAETLAEEYQIQTIPALWLVDRKGNLRDVNARGNLSGRVARLLDEK